MALGNLIDSGNAALQEGRWVDAQAAFVATLSNRETAEAHFGLAEALWWLGHPRSSLDAYERAYAGFRRADDVPRAAWTAMKLSIAYKADLGNQVAAVGWIARAERLLAADPYGALQGWLWLVRAYCTEGLPVKQRLIEQALDFARESRDTDLELCALADLGVALVEAGQVTEGFALIDESMAGTLGGEHHSLDTVVFTSCSMLTACELVADLERASQWSRVADGFVSRYGCPYLYAHCRTSYGSVLLATGDWAGAERELTAVLQMTRDVCPLLYMTAAARLAELRLRQGQPEEAEALLRDFDDEVVTALPRAALHLNAGDSAVAVAVLRRRLKQPTENLLELAPTLGLLVEAYLAQGDQAASAEIAERLLQLAQGRGGQVAAHAAVAEARVALARSDTKSAVRHFEEALEEFSRLQLAWDIARTRYALAEALAERSGDLAKAEARRALRAFERLGARSSADSAAALLRRLGAAGRSAPRNAGVLTQREQEVLRLIGMGYSNPEIADRLVISRKTAAHHVSSVLAKLGLRNRAEIVAYATRNRPDETLSASGEVERRSALH